MLGRCLIFIIVSVIWISSDLGQALIQASVFLLCLVFSVKNRNNRETAIQTDIALDLTPIQQTSKTDYVVSSDEPDSGKAAAARTPLHGMKCPNVQKSLHSMFTRAYTHLVLPWYTVAESRENQPLHSALLREFDLTTDLIIRKAVNLDLSVISVGCIRIFTRHLRNAKCSDGSPAYSCSADEIAVLREFSKALICNLFPQHLWEQELYCCALQEVLATRVLALVTLLSEPYNLNCLVVSQLGGASSESSEKEVRRSAAEGHLPSAEMKDAEGASARPAECSSDESRRKKKARKLKERVSNFFGHLKPKKRKKRKRKEEEDQYEIQMALSAIGHAAIVRSAADSSDSSISDSESDTEGDMNASSEMMEFKLSYEMWKAGKWIVTVTDVQMKDEELCFSIHLKEQNSPEKLHWDVRKTQAEIGEFYTCCKDMPHLSCISAIVENTHTELSENSKEDARAALEQFLQVLVSDVELGDTQLVFKFLCPIHKQRDGAMWLLLSGLASFLTCGQENDELNNLKGEEKPDENPEKSGLVTPQCDVTRTGCTDTVEKHGAEREFTALESLSDESPASASLTQATDCRDSLSEQPEVYCAGSERVDLNLVNFANRTNELLPKIQRAILHNSDDEDAGFCAVDGKAGHSCPGSVSKKEKQNPKQTQRDKPKGKKTAPEAKEETASQLNEQDELPVPSVLDKSEVNEVIFDLLKVVSGNSHVLKIIKAVLLPFTPLIKKKMNTFLKVMVPSEAQIAVHIDNLCKTVWPEEAEAPGPPQTSEDRNQTKDKALHLIVSKFAGYPILNKADLENMFKIFQEPQENKKLIYMLLVYLLREFLPGESFTTISKLNVKDTV